MPSSFLLYFIESSIADSFLADRHFEVSASFPIHPYWLGLHLYCPSPWYFDEVELNKKLFSIDGAKKKSCLGNRYDNWVETGTLNKSTLKTGRRSVSHDKFTRFFIKYFLFKYNPCIIHGVDIFVGVQDPILHGCSLLPIWCVVLLRTNVLVINPDEKLLITHFNHHYLLLPTFMFTLTLKPLRGI
jgi:hypothetical protein